MKQDTLRQNRRQREPLKQIIAHMILLIPGMLPDTATVSAAFTDTVTSATSEDGFPDLP